MKMLKPMLAKGSDIQSITVKREPTEKFNDELQEKIGGTVWTGCLSYYVRIIPTVAVQDEF